MIKAATTITTTCRQNDEQRVQQSGNEARAEAGDLVAKGYVFRGLNIEGFFGKGHV